MFFTFRLVGWLGGRLVMLVNVRCYSGLISNLLVCMRLWHSVSSAGSSSIVLRPKECQLISCVSHLERQIEAVMKVHLDRLMLVRVLMQLLIYRIFKATC